MLVVSPMIDMHYVYSTIQSKVVLDVAPTKKYIFANIFCTYCSITYAYLPYSVLLFAYVLGKCLMHIPEMTYMSRADEYANDDVMCHILPA